MKNKIRNNILHIMLHTMLLGNNIFYNKDIILFIIKIEMLFIFLSESSIHNARI